MRDLRAIETERLHLSRRALALATAGLALLLATVPARAATITVNSAADTAANDGKCTLREAITAANTDTVSGALAGECAAGTLGLDTIVFAIPAATDPGCVVGTGVCTIAPAFALPSITSAITIDGYTQAGALANTNTVASRLGLNGSLKIELKGNTGVGFDGLVIRAPGVTVRGLVINNCFRGIDAQPTTAGTVTLEGNYLGTSVGGTAFVTNRETGILAGGTGTIVIGGTTPAARNLISGNGRGTLNPGILTIADAAVTIQGNLIGTDATGLLPLGNSGPGINANPGTQVIIVGGTAPGAGNLVSANGYNNVSIFGGTGHIVQGNLVGTNVAGTAALISDLPFIPGNPREGVRLANASNSTIGGTTAAARNVVSGNVSGGIRVDSSSILVQGNYVGTDITGTLALGNAGIGIVIAGSPGTAVGGTMAGAGNIIAFTTVPGGTGVAIAIPGTGQSIQGNSIHSNGGIGIDLGLPNGSLDGVTPNDLGDADSIQNFPILTAAPIAAGAVTLSGTLNSRANGTFRIEFFSNTTGSPSGNGEGQSFIGFMNVTTDGTGNVSFTSPALAFPAGQTLFTATATSSTNNTSEFSSFFPLVAGPTPTPTPTATPTPTPTATPTPTPTPPIGGAASVPTLAPDLMALFGVTLAAAGLLLLRRSS